MRASIELSYQELDAADRARYNQLAVFAASGFSLIAASAVWGQTEGESRNALERMQDASLVKAVENAPGRFQLHDLLKEFGQEQLARDLDQEDATERAHAVFLIALFDKYYTDDLSTAPAVALELDNLVEAAEWAKNLDDGDTLALLATKPRDWLFNIFRINTEWLAWLETANRKGITTKHLKADTFQAIGDALRLINAYDASITRYKTALKLYRQNEDSIGQANTLKDIGDIQSMQNEYDAAMTSYKAALTLFELVGQTRGQGNTHRGIGGVQSARNEYDAAMTSYESALKFYQLVDDRLGEAYARRGIGNIRFIWNDHDTALAEYELALSLSREVGDHLGEALTYQDIGEVHSLRDQYDAALTNFKKAIALFEQIGNLQGQGDAYGSIGEDQRLLGKYDDALTSFNTALTLFQQVGNRRGQAQTFRSIGDVLRHRDYDAALACYNSALALFHQVGDSLGRANTYMSLGEIKKAQSDPSGSKLDVEKALDIYLTIRDRYSQSRALQLLGDIERDAQNRTRALELYQQGTNLLDNIGMSDLAEKVFGKRIKSVQ